MNIRLRIDQEKGQRLLRVMDDEGWNSQKQLSDQLEEKEKEKPLVSSSKALTRGIGLYSYVDVECKKN